MPARSQPQIPIDRLRKYISDGMTVRAICGADRAFGRSGVRGD
jgi:hypothetical protein